MAPIEGRGVVALWDSRLEQLTIYSACQMPHIVRTGLSECLGLDEGQVRVIAPDVGGGFGYKGILLAEEVCLGWLAMRCRPSGALDRGPPRASDRRRQLPRAPLPDHRLRRPRRHIARHRLRGRRRFRRLFGLSVLGLPGGGAGREHSAGSLRFSRLPLPHLFGRDQQMPDPALSRRGQNRRVLRAGTRARRHRARSRDRAARSAGEDSGEARADAVQQHHQKALRQRRLSGIAAPRGRRDRRCGRARAPAARRSRRPSDRRRPCDLLRAGRPRHLGLFRLGHSDGAGLSSRRPRA